MDSLTPSSFPTTLCVSFAGTSVTAAAVETETSVTSSSNTEAFDGGIGDAVAFVLVVVGAVMLRKTCRTLKKKDVARTDAFCPSAKIRFLMLALCASLVAAGPVRFLKLRFD
jgi:hypothetical protein